MDENTIDYAKHEADKIAPMAAEAEATFKDLVRHEPVVQARCILKYREETKNYNFAKAMALADPEYEEHLKKISAAQEEYLKLDKAFTVITDWMKLATSYCYKENSRLKAGV